MRSLRYDPGNVWPRIRQSESTLALYSSRTSACFKVNIRILFLLSCLLKQVHPDTGIFSKAMSIMNSFVNDIFERISTKASRLAHYNKWNIIQTSTHLMSCIETERRIGSKHIIQSELRNKQPITRNQCFQAGPTLVHLNCHPEPPPPLAGQRERGF